MTTIPTLPDLAAAPPALPATPLIEMDYATADAQVAGETLVLFRYLLVLAILSGPCVASCFLVLGQVPGGSLLHALVYAATLAVAVRSGLLMSRTAATVPGLRSPGRDVLDLIAGVGLAIIGFGPLARDGVYAFTGLAVHFSGPRSTHFEDGVTAIAVAFGLLTLSTYRHLPQYRGLAFVMASINRRGMATWLRVLGWIKFLFETAWLACCTAPLAAAAAPQSIRNALSSPGDGPAIFVLFGALFGIGGYAIVWIMMIIAHAQCCVALRRVATLGVLPPGDVWNGPGFEVIATESGPAA